MDEIVASVTERGQVTIPARVQRMLGIKPKSKVVFQIEGEQVRIVPMTFTLEDAFGSVEPLERPENFKEIERRVREERAARSARP